MDIRHSRDDNQLARLYLILLKLLYVTVITWQSILFLNLYLGVYRHRRDTCYLLLTYLADLSLKALKSSHVHKHAYICACSEVPTHRTYIRTSRDRSGQISCWQSVEVASCTLYDQKWSLVRRVLSRLIDHLVHLKMRDKMRWSNSYI